MLTASHFIYRNTNTATWPDALVREKVQSTLYYTRVNLNQIANSELIIPVKKMHCFRPFLFQILTNHWRFRVEKQVEVSRWLLIWPFKPWHRHAYSPNCFSYISYIISFILITCVLHESVILQGESRLWSLLGLKYLLSPCSFGWALFQCNFQHSWQVGITAALI